MFTDKDLAQIEAHGVVPAQVARQMDNFRRGFPFLPIVRAATPGDGIFEAGVDFRDVYRNSRPDVVKFVPASGAATRMFRDLFAFVETGEPNASAARTVDNIDKFAFCDALSGSAAGARLRCPPAQGAYIVPQICLGSTHGGRGAS